MARNGSGTYSKINTYVAGNTITAAGHNQNWDDLVAEMTNSVAADGQTPITGALKGANGTAAAPSYGFNSDPNTGTYRRGADELGFATGGVTAGYIDSSQVFQFAQKPVVPAKSFAISKIADGTANKLYGTDGSGVATEVTPSTGLTLSAGTLTAVAQLPRGCIDGCKLSNGTDTTNDINIAAGVCRDSTNAVDITVPATTGKQLDANWAAGGSAGMRNSAAGIADGTYHIYAGRTVASATADFYAYAGVAGTDPDSSASIATMLTAWQAETGGASYVYARRIRSIQRLSNAIIQFSQVGDEVLYTTVPAVASSTSLSTAATNFTTSVPVGLKVKGIFNISCDHASIAVALYVYSPDVSDQAVADAVAPLGTLRRWTGGFGFAANQQIRTNTSGQIRAVSDTSSTTIKIATLGYIDMRGKDA